MNGIANHGKEAQGGGFFAPVVSTSFKTFGDDGIYACFLRLEGKFYIRNYVHNRNAVAFEKGGEFAWIAGRGKYNRDFMLHNQFEVLFDQPVPSRCTKSYLPEL